MEKQPGGSVVHVIVGDVTSDDEPIIYRRQRLADYLARHPETAAVYWIAARLPAERRRGPDVRRIRGDALTLHRYVAPVPHPGARYVELLQRGPLRQVLAAVRSHAEGTPRYVLWFTVPQLSRLLREVPWDLIVYDCSDNWSGRPSGRSPAARAVHVAEAASERRIARACDVVFASSTFLADQIQRRFGREAVVIENGVDFPSFAQPSYEPPAWIQLPRRPRLAFVGALKPYKIDFALLLAAARATPEWSYVLIGPTRRSTETLRELLDLPNVELVGYRPPAEIPSLMRRMDVGLLPYRAAPYNRGVFPLKLFEYLAAGLPVVGCGLPSTLHHTEQGIYEHTDATPEAFLEGCRNALAWDAFRDARVERARSHDWAARLQAMSDVVAARLDPETARSAP